MFSTIAVSEPDTIPFCSSIRANSGSSANIAGSVAEPKPTAILQAAISRLPSLRRSTSDRMDIPETATDPNMTIMAPPSTAFGTIVVKAASLGRSPSTIMIPPAAKITLRVLMRDNEIKPTF
ncbi:hypothetical protein D3C71_1496100 [compost metagenome]